MSPVHAVGAALLACECPQISEVSFCDFFAECFFDGELLLPQEEFERRLKTKGKKLEPQSVRSMVGKSAAALHTSLADGFLAQSHALFDFLTIGDVISPVVVDGTCKEVERVDCKIVLWEKGHIRICCAEQSKELRLLCKEYAERSQREKMTVTEKEVDEVLFSLELLLRQEGFYRSSKGGVRTFDSDGQRLLALDEASRFGWCLQFLRQWLTIEASLQHEFFFPDCFGRLARVAVLQIDKGLCVFEVDVASLLRQKPFIEKMIAKRTGDKTTKSMGEAHRGGFHCE